MMITIRYCAEGRLVSDFALEEWYDRVRKSGSFFYHVSNELAIERVRVGIIEGDLPHQDVEFVFQGETLTPDADGLLDRWPEGFCDLHERLARRWLEASVKRGKQ